MTMLTKDEAIAVLDKMVRKFRNLRWLVKKEWDVLEIDQKHDAIFFLYVVANGLDDLDIFIPELSLVNDKEEQPEDREAFLARTDVSGVINTLLKRVREGLSTEFSTTDDVVRDAIESAIVFGTHVGPSRRKR